MQLSIEDAKLSYGVMNKEHCKQRGRNLEACMEKPGKAPSQSWYLRSDVKEDSNLPSGQTGPSIYNEKNR